MRLKLILIFVLFPSLAWGACVGPTQADVVSAIAAANNGDTVDVCSGNATWDAAVQGCTSNTMLCIKKNVTLKGPSDGSVVTLSSIPANGAIRYELDGTSNVEFSINGFIFDTGIFDATSGGILNLYNSGSSAITQVKIYNNTFKATPTLVVPGTSWTNHAENVWKATVTDTLNAYFALVFDSEYGGEPQANLAAVNSANEWYWESNVLYVYSTSDPDTAYTSPGIRYGRRANHAIVINGPIYGVAYTNTFTDIGTYIKIEGGNNSSYALGHLAYGTINSFFFEDNVISFTNAIQGDFGETVGQGGSLVFRYNTINTANNVAGNELGDRHGLQSMSDSNASCNAGCGDGDVTCYTETSGGTRCCAEWSQIKSESYGNSYSNMANTQGGYVYSIIHRGGKLLYFNNNFSGSYAGGSIPKPKYKEYACDTCQTPAGQNGGSDYVMHINTTYVFNNFWNGTDYGLVGIAADGTEDYCSSKVSGGYTITEDVDYWNLDTTNCPANSEGACTSGIGCGTFANRPATCTAGTAYWATAQSCSDISSYVGANTAAPLSGTLYICGSTGWADGSTYTPYTYPHPLRGESSNAAVTLGSGASMSIGSGAVMTLQ